MTVEFKRGDRFIYRSVAGEHLLVAIQKDQLSPLYTFSPTGAALWQELTDWRSAASLTDFLLGRYEVSPTDAARDVEEFLEQLQSLKALTTREVPQ